jgi:methionyl-tRNA synthetase
MLQRLGARANISDTVFLRTTEARHREAVEHVWVCIFFIEYPMFSTHPA